jgi:hypothetical protein
MGTFSSLKNVPLFLCKISIMNNKAYLCFKTSAIQRVHFFHIISYDTVYGKSYLPYLNNIKMHPYSTFSL